MDTEWEATFWPVDKDDVRERLRAAGATQSYPERLMRRALFRLPAESPLTSGWIRVRDEGDKITLAIKQSGGTTMESQKELQITADSYDGACALIRALGCADKTYQETRRELWELDGTEITIDEWPFIEPLVEVEGASEAQVREVATKIGFNWANAVFDTVDLLYSQKYGVPRRSLTSGGIPKLTFEMENPFQKSSE